MVKLVSFSVVEIFPGEQDCKAVNSFKSQVQKTFYKGNLHIIFLYVKIFSSG